MCVCVCVGVCVCMCVCVYIYELAGWYHRCNGHELGQTLGDDEEQGSLVCCSAWDCKELDKTGRLNNSICIKSQLIGKDPNAGKH